MRWVAAAAGRGRPPAGVTAHRTGRLPHTHRMADPTPRRPAQPRIVVLGDLAADVVLAPFGPLEPASDVPGRVAIRQGGSAANTARWVARLGADATLVCAVGRDRLGTTLTRALEGDGVRVRAVRVAGARTGRIGVLVAPDGERSFVADRGAAQLLAPSALRAAWFRRADVLHLPAYSLLGRPLGEAGFAAIGMARKAGARVTLDLASSAPLLADGRAAALSLLGRAVPDVILATESEVARLLGRSDPARLLDVAAAVVVKRGSRGATVLDGAHRVRFDVATRPVAAADTTGAGDAFDAGFLVGWLAALRDGAGVGAALRRGAAAGNRAAGRLLRTAPRELDLG